MQFLMPEFQNYVTQLAQNHAFPDIEATYRNVLTAPTHEVALRILKAFGNFLTYDPNRPLSEEYANACTEFKRQIQRENTWLEESTRLLGRKRQAEREPEATQPPRKDRKLS